jgi:bifunctional DNA-binding transcriptional regulator/antitoxin component of YhaV-PrlF toxin-antitoxin module
LENATLAKITSKNQLTLPKAIVKEFSGIDYFDIQAEDGRIVLTPLKLSRADPVRKKLSALGIFEQDVKDAIKWARSGK